MPVWELFQLDSFDWVICLQGDHHNSWQGVHLLLMRTYSYCLFYIFYMYLLFLSKSWWEKTTHFLLHLHLLKKIPGFPNSWWSWAVASLSCGLSESRCSSFPRIMLWSFFPGIVSPLYGEYLNENRFLVWRLYIKLQVSSLHIIKMIMLLKQLAFLSTTQVRRPSF